MNPAIDSGAAMASTISAGNIPWDPLPLLETIAIHSACAAANLLVFGSVARGEAMPRDIDVVFRAGRDEWAAQAHRPTLERLLSLARKHYGQFDVFVATGTAIYVRNDDATDFVRAKNAVKLREAMATDGVPLLDVLARKQAGLPVRRSSKFEEAAVAAVCAEFRLPRLAVVDLLSLPVGVLRERDVYFAMTNAMTPADFPHHQLGAAKIDRYITRVSESYIDYLDEFDSSTLGLVESEAGIKRHETYRRYIEMRKAGHEPPYVRVCENEKGHLVSSNRRRTLVAQELGLPLKGWRSPHNYATRLPLKYGDVLSAYARALAALKGDSKPSLVS